MRFDSTNVLITGGASGLGLACAERFLQEGATVTIAGRREERLRQAAAHLAQLAGSPTHAIRCVVCDVTDEPAVRRAVEVAAEGAGLRLVVASAGLAWASPLAATPVEQWRSVVETTLTGVFLTLKHAVPAMVEAGGGAFTAISSVNAVRPARFFSPYCSAKAGVDMLIRTAADELGPAGIRVNAVRPGLVPTEMSAGVVEDDELRADFLAQMPLGRLGTPGDVSSAVAFLSSSDATWITGVCLSVDGGHHLRRGQRMDAWVRQQHPASPRWWGIDG